MFINSSSSLLANSLQFSVRLIVCLDPYLIYEIPYAIKALEFLHAIIAEDIKDLHDNRSLRVH